MKKTILAVFATSTIGIISFTTMSHGFDSEFNDGCQAIYELGQDNLKSQSALEDMADNEIGVTAKDIYADVDDLKSEFQSINQAFRKCQSNMPFSIDFRDFTTSDIVEVWKEKLSDNESIHPCSNESRVYQPCVERGGFNA